MTQALTLPALRAGPLPLPQCAGLSGENWRVVCAERFAANFGSESPLPGLVPVIHGVPSMFNSLEVQVLYPS